MKVLGIDPGLAKCGCAVVEKQDNKKFNLVACKEITTNNCKTVAQRLKKIFVELEKFISTYKPDIVCIEAQFYSKIAKNIINTYFATGIVYLLCGLKKIEIKEFPAKTIKLAISGYGSASKSQVRKMLSILLDYNKKITSSHINDAIAVALCYLTSSEINVNNLNYV